MNYTKENTVICIDGDSLKTCALYFDKIMPLSVRTIFWPMDEVLEAELNRYINQISTDKIEHSVFDEIFIEEQRIICEISTIEHEFYKYRTGQKKGDGMPFDGPDDDYISNTLHPKHGYFRDCIKNTLNKYGFDGKYPVIAPEKSIFASTEQSTGLLLSLVGLELINTENVLWEQIIEIRQDLDASSKLRRLRLFLYKNYLNQSPAYIEDDISDRVDTYLNACKKHGLQTSVSNLDILLNSKSTIALGIGAMMAIVAGSPMVGTGAILAGASIEIGKLCLNVAKHKHSFSNFENDHELAYIFKAKKILED
ncbi:MAG: hypothetical protein JRI92_06955 [Deltaproteobacteria bacterium]|nr:hypothetical protein [Deltaproteobacteria bacterium]